MNKSSKQTKLTSQKNQFTCVGKIIQILRRKNMQISREMEEKIHLDEQRKIRKQMRKIKNSEKKTIQIDKKC